MFSGGKRGKSPSDKKGHHVFEFGKGEKKKGEFWGGKRRAPKSAASGGPNSDRLHPGDSPGGEKEKACTPVRSGRRKRKRVHWEREVRLKHGGGGPEKKKKGCWQGKKGGRKKGNGDVAVSRLRM